MNTTRLLGLAVSLCVTTVVATIAQEPPLTRAKQLYEAASYSEALAVLKQDISSGDVVEAETYRALCFLALGQPRDAERALEQLVLAKPFATLDPASVSPRIVSIFEDVRKRTIPTAAKELYQRGRTKFDQGDLEGAASQFEEVITLAQSAPPERAELMEELKMLATGFVRLAENSRKPSETTPTVETTASPVPEITTVAGAATTTPVGPAPVGPDVIFDASSPNVIPPTAIKRDIPRKPKGASAWRGNQRGIIEVIVGETGTVIETTMLLPVHPVYDLSLRGATQRWRYTPATDGGRPVKYRLRYGITFNDSSPVGGTQQ